MRWGLRYQLLVPPILLLLAVIGITTWTAIASAQRARLQLDERVRQVVQALNKSEFPRNETGYKLLQLLSGAKLLELGADRKVLGGTLRSVPEKLPEPHTDPAEMQLDAHVLVDGEPYLCGGIRLREKSDLYLFYPEALWRDALWQAVKPSLLIGGIVGLASVALAIAVGQRLTRRFQELERRTRQIASGDFSPMPLPTRHDEIYDLTASINDMAQRLAQLQETVQRTERLRLLGQVSGGLAHQLRNGVTGARLAVQLHQRELAQGAPPDLSALDVALRQLTLVETNLKRFLELGSRKPGSGRACSLTALLNEATALLQPQCRHAHIELRWEPPDQELSIRGDSGQLQQLFVNVLSNAVEAAGPGGQVEVMLRQEEKMLVEICDSGPGPPPEVSARLFEPFVTGKPEGVGLGLAVARQAAESHNGQITWSRRDGRTCFRIELDGMRDTG
jgi:signal transduction histidine kinase